MTQGSFYERLADHGYEIVTDDVFAELYAPSMGRPSIPPSVMVRAMLCATHDKTSDAETSRRTRVDADWKAAMGVDDEFTGIAPSTFSLMLGAVSAWVGFADGLHGWAAVAAPPYAGGTGSSLFATFDGGSSWRSLGPSPVDGPLHPVDTTTAFALGSRLRRRCAKGFGQLPAPVTNGR